MTCSNWPEISEGFTSLGADRTVAVHTAVRCHEDSHGLGDVARGLGHRSDQLLHFSRQWRSGQGKLCCLLPRGVLTCVCAVLSSVEVVLDCDLQPCGTSCLQKQC